MFKNLNVHLPKITTQLYTSSAIQNNINFKSEDSPLNLSQNSYPKNPQTIWSGQTNLKRKSTSKHVGKEHSLTVVENQTSKGQIEVDEATSLCYS